MSNIRQIVENQKRNFRDALINGGMTQAAATIYADELTDFVAARLILRRRREVGEQTRQKKQELRAGVITLAEYNEWYNANRIDEFATINPDGSIDFGTLEQGPA